MIKVVPLPHEWMIISIIGFFVSIMLIYPQISEKWGAAFTVFFVLMFIASMVSMTYASTDPEHLDALAVHYKRK